MIAIIFIIGCFLTFFFLVKKSKIENYNLKKGVLYYFYKNSLDFLVPFVVITFLYLMLFLVVALASNSTPLYSLIHFEESLEKFKSIFSIFKLNAIQVFFILIAIYLLGFLRFFAHKSKRLFSLFNKYQSFVRWVYIVLVLLCSFTFFGTQLGEPTTNLSLRIKIIRDGYADLCKDVQDTIAEEVAIDIYSKVHDQFPQSYQDALEAPRRIEQEATNLRDYYNSVRSEFDINEKNIDAILEKNSIRMKTASDLAKEIKFSGDLSKGKNNFTIPDPRQINYKKIKDARTAVAKYRSRLQPRVIKYLQIEGGKEITSQIPKIFTGKVEKTLFQQVFKGYPVLEPIIDIFFRTLDREMETKVEQAIDQVTNATISNPENLGKVIEEESDKIVQQKNIEIPKEILKNATRVSKQINTELGDIKKSKDILFNSIIPKKPNVTLNSNLSVDISWASVPEAQSYRLYWSSNKNSALIDVVNSEKTNNTAIKRWLKVDEFPVYYRITAIKGNGESLPSKASEVALLSDEGGTRCQVCGKKAIGYCHNRNIYVCSSCNYYTSESGTYWRCP